MIAFFIGVILALLAVEVIERFLGVNPIELWADMLFSGVEASAQRALMEGEIREIRPILIVGKDAEHDRS